MDYTIVGPDGREFTISGPENATPQQLRAAAERAYKLTADEAPKEDARPWQQRLLQNAGAGLVRGAGSIGATLLTPFDMLAGNTKSIGNPERRQAMDDAFKGMGVDTGGAVYGGSKLLGEVAGTAGVGGVMANGLRMIPGAARAAPVLDAVRSAGFSAGGATGAAGLGARTLGGAVTGGASAGLVNPEDAAAGAIIGGTLPGALQLGSAAGGAAGRMMRGPQQTPDLAAAIDAAQRAGYVIPPTQANPSLGNRMLEGLAGKLTTAQNASAQNQTVTNTLAARALGLADDTKISMDVLNQVRAEAGRGYQQIKTLGELTGDARFNNQIAGLKGAYEGAAKDFPGLAKPELSQMLDSLKQPTFKASSAVDAVRILRDEADKAFRQGDKGVSKALRQASSAMEDLIERNLLRMNADASLTSIMRGGGSVDDIVGAGVNNPAAAMLKQFRDARQLIAKTYSVEKALNPTTGTIDAQKLAGQLNRRSPLSGELKQAADFANRFKTASRPVESMGSLPQTSPLDWALAGGMTAATSNPLGMVGLLARPGARSLALSPMVQSRLRQSPGLLNSLPLDELTRAGLLSGPVMAAD